MRFIMAVALTLLVAASVSAQQQQFVGSGSADGVTWDWNLSTDSTLVNSTNVETGQPYSYENVLLNGKIIDSIGGSLTLIDDTFQYIPKVDGNIMNLLDWGPCTTGPNYQIISCEWELESTPTGAELLQVPPSSVGDGGGSGPGGVVTPEPSTFILLTVGIIGIVVCRRVLQL